MEASTVYTARIAALGQEAAALTARKRPFALGRLASFLAAPLLFFLVLNTSLGLATGLALLSLAIFVRITSRDLENNRRLRYTQTLIRINEEELGALAYNFSPFGHGEGYLPREHPYAADLDIVGPHSVYRMLNRTTSAPGADLLASWLLEPADRASILTRQEAVRELQEEVDWRQQLRAKGLQAPLSADACAQLRDWISTADAPPNRLLSRLAIALPGLSAVLIALCAAAVLPWKILWLALAAQLLLIRQLDKLVAPAYRQLSRAHKSLSSLQESLASIRHKPWSAARLQALQERCGHGSLHADALLSRLSRILDRLDLRLNPLVHVPLNIATCWDWHQYLRMEQWRQQYHEALRQWIDAYAETEVLSSFATTAFNCPDWCFPLIAEKHLTLSARALGHPLLAAPVRNDIALEGQGKIMLITGSNMAGKSTFLRTVGVNMVLAMAGAPVRAGAMEVSVSPVRSSMRIADNLEENISTFYAELKKLKMILEAVRRREPVFLLLDEILRGTNSQDRHTGARALLRQLLEAGAVGMLATHDLALTDMERSYPEAIVNHHFDVQVQGEELSFDYRLKPGVCRSMNASLLMRKIGIDIQ